jgi:uncharacterized cofD-like protein
MKNITVIGGGTGTFVVLSGLKNYDYNLSAVVTSMDSGGSTGKLRDQYGVLPPGDVRQCLVALSEASELWRKLFLYRFDTGDFKGHNFGNIFLTALSPNPDLNTFNITYNFNQYFAIPGKQSFVVSKGDGPSYNGPYFKENGVSALCSITGTY